METEGQRGTTTSMVKPMIMEMGDGMATMSPIAIGTQRGATYKATSQLKGPMSTKYLQRISARQQQKTP